MPTTSQNTRRAVLQVSLTILALLASPDNGPSRARAEVDNVLLPMLPTMTYQDMTQTIMVNSIVAEAQAKENGDVGLFLEAISGYRALIDLDAPEAAAADARHNRCCSMVYIGLYFAILSEGVRRESNERQG